MKPGMQGAWNVWSMQQKVEHYSTTRNNRIAGWWKVLNFGSIILNFSSKNVQDRLQDSFFTS